MAPVVALMPEPVLQFFNNNGIPLSGGKLYCYTPGSGFTNLKDTYTDNTALSSNTNPVVADAAGRMAVWLDGYYDMKLTDSSGVTIWTSQNVSSLVTSGTNPLTVDMNLIDATAGTQTFTMPVGEAIIVKTDATANPVNIVCLAGKTFADGVGVSLSVKNESVTYVLIGTVYYQV